MELLARFKVIKRRAFYHPSGSASSGQLADMITAALQQARNSAVADVVINIAAMTGFDSPGPAYRRWAARRWAWALGPGIPVAMVARGEHICPEKTGLLVAAEEGLDAHICITETEAVDWLDALQGAAPANPAHEPSYSPHV